MRTNARRLWFALLLGLIADTGAVRAAEEGPAEPNLDEDQTAEEMLAAEAALEAQQATAAQQSGDSGTADPADATASDAGEDSPGIADEDFVPTIQISEDLSVSFPVDI